MSEKLNQLQMIEQNLQQLIAQKQQFQGQLIEIESAISELEKSKDAYKIVGNIMVKTPNKELAKDLEDKKQRIDIRIKSVEKQEAKFKENGEAIRKELMSEMKEK